jgi:hypothetical protein
MPPSVKGLLEAADLDTNLTPAHLLVPWSHPPSLFRKKSTQCCIRYTNITVFVPGFLESTLVWW